MSFNCWLMMIAASIFVVFAGIGFCVGLTAYYLLLGVVGLFNDIWAGLCWVQKKIAAHMETTCQ